MTADLSPGGRTRSLERMRAETWDVLVIGGGVVGAGIARDAAMRGLKTALLEKGDFASGTSGKTSRLVHGGLRYLAKGKVGLVREAVRERDLLLRRAPALVRPLPFTIPAYRSEDTSPRVLRVGLWLYDNLSRHKVLPRRKWLRPEGVKEREPGLRDSGLMGGGLYYDAITDDARLVLAVVRSAADHGAAVANHAEVVELIRQAGTVRGARARDRLSGETFDVRARVVVNATGVWLDRLRPKAGGTVRPTKGIHVFLPRSKVGNREAVTLTSPRDGRVLFVLPWGRLTLVGTTDTDFSGDPDRVVPDAGDVAYLLETVNAAFPAAHAGPEDVVSLYAGLRPLIRTRRIAKESDISREHAVFEDPDGLISVAGGKLTTQRAMADEVVSRVCTRLGKSVLCKTAAESLGPPSDAEAAFRGMGLDPEVAARLATRHDPKRFMRYLDEPRASQRIVPETAAVWAEVDVAVDEMTCTLEDVLVRRIGLFYEADDLGRSVAQDVATRIAPRLGRDSRWISDQVAAYEALIDAHLAFRGDHGR